MKQMAMDLLIKMKKKMDELLVMLKLKDAPKRRGRPRKKK